MSTEPQTVLRTKHDRNFTSINNDVLLNEALSSDARFLLVIAMSRPSDWSFTTTWLQKVTGWGRDKLRQHVGELIKSGHASREQVRSKGIITHTVLTFFEAPQTGNQALVTRPWLPGPENPSHTKKEVTKTDNQVTPLPPKGGCEGDFAEFWEVYPRKDGKAKAQRLFNALREAGVSTTELIGGAGQYALSRKGQEARYTKYASTWLQEEGWKDAPETTSGSEQLRQAIRSTGGETSRDTDEPMAHQIARAIVAGHYKGPIAPRFAREVEARVAELTGACDGR